MAGGYSPFKTTYRYDPALDGVLPGTAVDDAAGFAEGASRIDSPRYNARRLTEMKNAEVADVAASQAAFRKDLRANLALSAAPTLLQAASLAVPTAQDRRNKERIAELEEKERTGRLGLSSEEREAFDQALGSTRALAADARRATEAREASTGSRTSAATAERARRAEQAAVLDQATQIGLQKARANLEAAERQRQELEARLAQKSDRQKQALSLLAQSAAGLAPVVGMARAGRAIETMDPSVLEGLSGKERVQLIETLYRYPGQEQNIKALYSGRVGL